MSSDTASTPFPAGLPGPVLLRGCRIFGLISGETVHRAPLPELVEIMDVGYTCALAATPSARRFPGSTLHIDRRQKIMA
jgi:enoyl-[acyl-carrier protein] reductase I